MLFDTTKRSLDVMFGEYSSTLSILNEALLNIQRICEKPLIADIKGKDVYAEDGFDDQIDRFCELAGVTRKKYFSLMHTKLEIYKRILQHECPDMHLTLLRAGLDLTHKSTTEKSYDYHESGFLTESIHNARITNLMKTVVQLTNLADTLHSYSMGKRKDQLSKLISNMNTFTNPNMYHSTLANTFVHSWIGSDNGHAIIDRIEESISILAREAATDSELFTTTVKCKDAMINAIRNITQTTSSAAPSTQSLGVTETDG